MRRQPKKQPRNHHRSRPRDIVKTLDTTDDPIGFAIRKGFSDLYTDLHNGAAAITSRTVKTAASVPGAIKSAAESAAETAASVPIPPAIQQVVSHLRDDSLIEGEYYYQRHSVPSNILRYFSRFMPKAVGDFAAAVDEAWTYEAHVVANNAVWYMQYVTLFSFTFHLYDKISDNLGEEAQSVFNALVSLSAMALALRIVDWPKMKQSPYYDNITGALSLPAESYIAAASIFNTALHTIPVHLCHRRAHYASIIQDMAQPFLSHSLWKRANEVLFLPGNRRLRSDANTSQQKLDHALKRWIQSMPVPTNNMEYIAYAACADVALMLLANSEVFVICKAVELTLGEPYVAPIRQLITLSGLAVMCSAALECCPAGQKNMLGKALNVLVSPAKSHVESSLSMVLNGFSAVMRQIPRHAETSRVAGPGFRL